MDDGGQFAETLLDDGLVTARAWEMLHTPAIVHALDMDGYKELCMRAGYGEAASERAAARHGLQRLRRGETM